MTSYNVNNINQGVATLDIDRMYNFHHPKKPSWCKILVNFINEWVLIVLFLDGKNDLIGHNLILYLE